MDIDEFLDKELLDERTTTYDNPKTNIPEGTNQLFIPKTEEKKITGSGVQIIQTQTAQKEDRLYSLETAYFDLWNRISKQSMYWNNELYVELNKIGTEIKNEISRLSSEIESKKNTIKELIYKSGRELENKRYAEALKLYHEVIRTRDSLPDFLLEDKNEINDKIIKLYEKLHKDIDSKFISDFKKSIEEIKNIIIKSHASLDNGDMENAKNFYETAFQAYISLPNGFLLEKIDIGNHILGLYKKLSINKQIVTLQQQLDKERSKIPSESAIETLRRQESANDHETPEKHQDLLRNLISRKLIKAKISLRKGLYSNAKKDIQSILELDPNNEDAKQMLTKLPN